MSDEYKNINGDSRYQPALLGGERLWRTDIGLTWNFHNDSYGSLGPKLYKSKRRADRVADRRTKRLNRVVFSVTENTE